MSVGLKKCQKTIGFTRFHGEFFLNFIFISGNGRCKKSTERINLSNIYIFSFWTNVGNSFTHAVHAIAIHVGVGLWKCMSKRKIMHGCQKME